AAYETTLRPLPSPFDRYVERTLALTPVPTVSPVSTVTAWGSTFGECATTGLRVFIGKGRCVNCHNGPRLENGSFHATGVPQLGDGDNPGGRIRGIELANKDPFNCRGRFGPRGQSGTRSKPELKDEACTELDHALRGSPLIGNAFKTPTLRNVALSPPYM